jgi:hypothetical protein
MQSDNQQASPNLSSSTPSNTNEGVPSYHYFRNFNVLLWSVSSLVGVSGLGYYIYRRNQIKVKRRIAGNAPSQSNLAQISNNSDEKIQQETHITFVPIRQQQMRANSLAPFSLLQQARSRRLNNSTNNSIHNHNTPFNSGLLSGCNAFNNRSEAIKFPFSNSLHEQAISAGLTFHNSSASGANRNSNNSRLTLNAADSEFQMDRLISRTGLAVELLILLVVLFTIFIAMSDARWLIPLGPTLIWIIYIVLTRLNRTAQNLTARSVVSAMANRFVCRGNNNNNTLNDYEGNSGEILFTSSGDGSEGVPNNNPVTPFKPQNISNYPNSPFAQEGISEQFIPSSDPIDYEALNESKESSESERNEEAEQLESQPEEISLSPSLKFIRVVEPQTKQFSSQESKDPPAFNLNSTALNSNSNTSIASTDSNVSSGHSDSETDLAPHLADSSASSSDNSVAGSVADLVEASLQEEKKSPAGNLSEREQQFYAQLASVEKPRVPSELISSSSNLNVKFTFHHNWNEVVQQFWNSTHNSNTNNATNPSNLYNSVHTANSAVGPQFHYSRHNRSNSRSRNPIQSNSSVYTVVDQFHSTDGHITYTIRSVLMNDLKLPPWVRQLIQTQSNTVKLVEYSILNRLTHSYTVYTSNVIGRSYALATDKRVFTSHPEHAEYTELHCKFELQLLTSCGKISSSLYRWIVQNWRLYSQQFGTMLANELDSAHKQMELLYSGNDTDNEGETHNNNHNTSSLLYSFNNNSS